MATTTTTMWGWNKNRTNVRFWEPAARLAFRAFAAVAPAAAEMGTVALFATPARRRSRREPQVPGLLARRTSLAAGVHRLAVWQWGQGPVVLLAHGWSGAAAQMTGFVPGLVRAGFRVVAFDHPGHGQSNGKRVTVLDLRDAVRAVGEAFGPPHAVIAHSLGGSATALALAQGLPAGRAVLIAPPADVGFFARAFAERLGLPPSRVPGVLARVREALGVDPASLDLRLLASRMTTPMLLLHDPADPEVPFEHSRAIAAAWPGARLAPLANLGHGRPLRDPRTIIAAVDFAAG
jgi:pimeloyl-ACP methyl ester carboxylesterase